MSPRIDSLGDCNINELIFILKLCRCSREIISCLRSFIVFSSDIKHRYNELRFIILTSIKGYFWWRTRGISGTRATPWKRLQRYYPCPWSNKSSLRNSAYGYWFWSRISYRGMGPSLSCRFCLPLRLQRWIIMYFLARSAMYWARNDF